jgi:1-acyl-sn-glycerol-3-phosphate acyltransferase
MFNTEKIQPTGKVIPKIMRVKMVFGEPMFFEGDSSDLLYLRDITDQIMKKIQELSGQEYVDIYASRRKDELKDESED